MLSLLIIPSSNIASPQVTPSPPSISIPAQSSNLSSTHHSTTPILLTSALLLSPNAKTKSTPPPTPTPRPTPTSSPTPIQTPPPHPTSTPAPSLAPTPTSTSSPIPTPTQTPTFTPIPNPASTETPTPPPQETIVPAPTLNPPTPTQTIAVPTPTSSPKPAQSPEPLFTPTVLEATSTNGSIFDLAVNGITAKTVSNVVISPDQSTAQTTLSLAIIGQTIAGNLNKITVPKAMVTCGVKPTIYINNQVAQNQGFFEDSSSYHFWYKTIFSSYELSIVFVANHSTIEFPTSVILTIVAIVPLSLAMVALKKHKFQERIN